MKLHLNEVLWLFIRLLWKEEGKHGWKRTLAKQIPDEGYVCRIYKELL
jgi:hypothetical protein